MPSKKSPSKVPPDIASLALEVETGTMPPRTPTKARPSMTSNKPSPRGKIKASAEDQDDCNSPDEKPEPIPDTPDRYSPFLRALHLALLAISTISDPQIAHDPTLAYLKVLSHQHLSDLTKLLDEDGHADWLAQNPTRMEVMVKCISLQRELVFGKYGTVALHVAETELDQWFKEVKDDDGTIVVDGEWDAGRKGRELAEVVGKVKALEKAGTDRPKSGVVSRREEPLPPEPQTWERKQRVIAASKRLQQAMFGDGPVTPMKGKIQFGPEIRKTR